MFNSELLEKKWAPILESKDAPAFADQHRKAVTTVLLENQELALKETNAQASFLNEAAGSNSVGAGAVAGWDPVLISLVRRSMPNLIAFDVAGVQPMTQPTGLVFSMRSKYNDAATDGGTALPPIGGGTPAEVLAIRVAQDESNVDGADSEALFDTIDQSWSGAGTATAGTGMPTAEGEGDINRDMGFTVDRHTVTAKTRVLKADYTMELAQDLKAVHGLDAEAELANILSTEILAEINQELISNITFSAKQGATGAGTVTDGTFDFETDSDGRWQNEKYKTLLFQIELEANAVYTQTRRGKANFMICSSNVASALASTGQLEYAPTIGVDLNVDVAGNTFAGTLNGRMKVYIDPYALADFVTVGFRGTNSYDAGIFYCPYVPLTMIKAQDEKSFQPKIGFKTRYGITANPFADTAGAITSATNPYFRTFLVANLTGIGA